jgi:hypothetical protein
MGVHVAEAAATLLLQEEKFKYYFAQLTCTVRVALAWLAVELRHLAYD